MRCQSSIRDVQAQNHPVGGFAQNKFYDEGSLATLTLVWIDKDRGY